MQLAEFERNLKYRRILSALEAAEKASEDVFYACQEASTEVERNQVRIRLERIRNATRTNYQKIGKIREAIDQEFNSN